MPPPSLWEIEDRCEEIRERERESPLSPTVAHLPGRLQQAEDEIGGTLTDDPNLPRLFIQAVRRGGEIRPLLCGEESIRTSEQLAQLDAGCNVHLGAPVVLRIVHRFRTDTPPPDLDPHVVDYPAVHGLLTVPLRWCEQVALCEEVAE